MKIARLLLGSLIVLGSFSNLQGQQQDFRVETDIHFDNQKGAPTKQSVTLFRGGLYYDYSLDDPTAITIIDPAQERIILLDIKRNIKTTINTRELLELVEAAKTQAQTSPELVELVSAANNVMFDPAKNTIVVGSSQMQYQSTTQQPPGALMAQQYADFASWSARLNAVYTSKRPPFVRLQLNKELADRGLMPAEITLSTGANGKSAQTRSRLLAQWQLSPADLEKIQQTNEKLVRLNDVKQMLFFAQQKP
jgi:hypothetical protein